MLTTERSGQLFLETEEMHLTWYNIDLQSQDFIAGTVVAHHPIVPIEGV